MLDDPHDTQPTVPSILCYSDGRASTSISYLNLTIAAAVDVTLPDGRRELLRLAPHSWSGMTSRRWYNDRVVLKITGNGFTAYEGLARHEACMLKTLRGCSVPILLCSHSSFLIMENVGSPLTVANLPENYREQAETILAELRARQVRHNDIWKDDVNSPSLFSTELLVDSTGRMRLIDFNTATIQNQSHACAVAPFINPKYFTPSRDEHLVHILDAMYLANRTLSSYRSVSGVRDVRHGICRRPLRPVALDLFTRGATGRPQSPSPVAAQHHARPRDPSVESAACHGDASNGEFQGVFTDRPLVNNRMTDPRTTMLRLPSAINPMPMRSDVQACVSRCLACSRCHTISVSSQRSACLWYALLPPRNVSGASSGSVDTCETVGGSQSMLRTSWSRPRVAPPANHSWELSQKLDDFVTVSVERPSATDGATKLALARGAPLVAVRIYKEHTHGTSGLLQTEDVERFLRSKYGSKYGTSESSHA